MLDLYGIIKSQPAFFKQLNCKDLLFTEYDCPQAERKESFFYECNYVAYVISGRRIFHRQGKSWELTEGKMVFVRRGAHIAEKLAGEGWCVMVFFMPDSYLQQLLKENRTSLPFKNLPAPSKDYILDLNVSEITEGFFYSMIPYFNQKSAVGEALLDLKFRELMLSILINPENRSLVAYLNSLDDQHNFLLQNVMEANFMFNLSLEQYCKLCNRSLATFKRDFIKIYKIPPARWVKEQRLALAGSLLTSTSRRVQDIAYDTGFENTTHFCRVFKEQYGISALDYRKQSAVTDVAEAWDAVSK